MNNTAKCIQRGFPCSKCGNMCMTNKFIRQIYGHTCQNCINGIIAEKRHLEEQRIAEERRIAEEKRLAEFHAMQRIAEEKRLAAIHAEEQRIYKEKQSVLELSDVGIREFIYNLTKRVEHLEKENNYLKMRIGITEDDDFNEDCENSSILNDIQNVCDRLSSTEDRINGVFHKLRKTFTSSNSSDSDTYYDDY